jgi:translation initiation factor 2B subunit (eIF-2B alpha/beta/delta family)
MKKVRRNISLDADVEEAVDERAENFSGQVNEWAARRYRDGEFYVLDRALIGRMIDTVETHREEMHDLVDERCDDLVAELQAIDEHIDDQASTHAADEYTLDDVAESLNLHRGRNPGELDPENLAVRNQAEKIGIEPNELVQQLAEVYS